VFSTNFAAAELNHVARLITEIQAFYTRTIRQPYLTPWFRVRGRYGYHDQLTAELRTLLGGYIAKRRAANEAPSAPAPPDDLLQMLLDVRYEDTGLPMTDEQVLDEALILLIAGHETSANALTWLLYLLGQHPAEAEAIRAETAAVLEARGPGQAQAAFGFEELPRLGRALYAVQEAMRLYPPAWMVDRVSLADDEYQGLRIPKGTLFSLYIYGLHHAPKYWQQPAQFRPERFAPGQPPIVPATYVPFGGGPRLCIGMQFALTEMQLVTLELLRHFAVELPADTPAIPTQPLITLRPKGDFPLRLRLL
jgi:cytochrome P450